MKKLFLLIILSVNYMLLSGQQQHKQPAFPWSVRFNFTGLADPYDGNISIGAEYAVGSRLSVIADFAYIFYARFPSEILSASGVLIRPVIRYYMSNSPIIFFEAAPFYKHAGYKMEDWVGKDCINGIPAYKQYQKYIFRRRVLGLNLQAGIQAVLSKDKALRLEFYTGLGIRIKWEDIKDDSRACPLGRQIFGGNNTKEPQVLPGFPQGIRLVYNFKSRA